MNPILLLFADGSLFFVGMAVVGIAVLLLACARKKWMRRALTAATLIGAVVVVISSTPLPVWAYVLWAAVVAVGLILGNREGTPRRMRIAGGFLTLAATAGLCLAEAPYHFAPRIVVPQDTIVYVVGDSISAGMGTGERCWPEVLESTSGLTVVNLALAGGTVQSARRQAEGITRPNSIVIVEIGGNDLLGGGDAGEFRRELDLLLSSLSSFGHVVVMFELPLLPLHHGFGWAQRDIAAKYGVTLLPKRFLTEVVGLAGGTLDGLHLSQEGHHALAEMVGQTLEKASSSSKLPAPRSLVGQFVKLEGRFGGPGKLADYVVVPGGQIYLFEKTDFGGRILKYGTRVIVEGTLGYHSASPLTPGEENLIRARASAHFFIKNARIREVARQEAIP